MLPAFAQVLLDGPLAGTYPYRIPAGLDIAAGQWVVVPWGKARRVGIVAALADTCDLAPEKLRDVEQLLPELPPLASQWLEFIRFAAGYYQGEAAELGLGSVPKLLRVPPSPRTRKRADARLAAFDPTPVDSLGLVHDEPAQATAEQQALLEMLIADSNARADAAASAGVSASAGVAASAGAASSVGAADRPAPRPWLLHGVTSSSTWASGSRSSR